MVTTRNRSLPAETPDQRGGDAAASLYEKSRNERIKENKERMKNLGILHLSLNLKSEDRCHTRAKPVRAPRSAISAAGNPSSPAAPPRRSSRLQSVTPVVYSEDRVGRHEKPLADDRSVWICEGHMGEVYTEEHEKLLGSCEMDWNLFVDGYDSSGKRIYDQVKGKTCHQCRQKTLGHRTSCTNCNLVQGQFCGDCLYMRYGENVLEAKKNSSWICPACRGICNCSFCRIKKGWAPTGILYKRVKNLGYKSVAHFLIQTKRGHSADNKPIDSPNNPKSSAATELVVKPETFTIDEDEGLDNNSVKIMEPIGGAGDADADVVISNIEESMLFAS